MINVLMVALGCPKNRVDSEMMLAQFMPPRFAVTAEEDLADVAVINTCGFIESAKEEAIGAILHHCRLKERGRLRAVVVTGCLAQRYCGDIAREIPEVDAVVGLLEQKEIADVVENAYYGIGAHEARAFENNIHVGPRVLTTPFYSAYLKIADGCDNRCSYCAIPLIRGGFVSRPIEGLVEEARGLAQGGVREIVLVAQDTTRYGEDLYGESRLPELIEQIAAIPEIRWIRLLYLYPERIDDKLLRAIAGEPKVVRSVDMPVQHCSGDVLRRMNRRMDEGSLLSLIEKIRAAVPGIELRTTVLVGFPGETGGDFDALCRFVERARFHRLGCFAFSPEEGTPAHGMAGAVPLRERRRRADAVMRLQGAIAGELQRDKIGRVVEAVVEEVYTDGTALCRTAADAPEIDYSLHLAGAEGLRPGDFVAARVTGARPNNDLDGALERKER